MRATCPYNHPMTPENTYTVHRREGWIQHDCRTCRRIRNRQTRDLEYIGQRPQRARKSRELDSKE